MLPDGTTLPDDTARLRAAVAFVREHDTATLLPLLLPGLRGPELESLAPHCRFAHAGLLLFPTDPQDLRRQLADCGLAVDTPSQPSVVVRERLARRHRRDLAELDVRILRPRVEGPAGERRAVEVFALTVPAHSDLGAIAAHERARGHEAHLALELEHPDPLVLHGLCAVLARHGARPDGGGYNPHEDGTVLYFTTPAAGACGYRRLELYTPGDHRDALDDHLRADPQERPDPARPAETLLRLLTGAWTTQALAAFARLGLPDAMDPHTATSTRELARRTATRPENLGTLLRYLTMLDVVAESGKRTEDTANTENTENTEAEESFRLTRLGALLRADSPDTMRPLALMYAGPFYRSFAALDHTVRTGQPAFDHLFGENHFDHFARDPELADLFDRSMAASSRMFEPLPAHPVIAAAARASTPRTVVDVAGGNGELLGRILTAHPGLRGTLLERPHAVEAARRVLDSAGCGARCDYRSGDFADVPRGGDVYVLSRILHDWDDDRCREILRHCARAMPAHADLLIVERLLPADGSPSLATAWDLHMMCNVGGRERRAGHYARLLADAGLELLDRTPLPLEAYVLHARKAR
ncbi:methyltransferase [Streptomyces sp. NBC_00347]|uniref:methyltransferase n=1 Tax=Streptomyces sp. NBC_00347 TaxID=2975721 RepID=UPI002258BA52|nr:methyltransferase [Streptomyces sp. NBC_00347]MCX5129661.1 methyltransferase [Streptomyces sp. NBC_00347]